MISFTKPRFFYIFCYLKNVPVSVPSAGGLEGGDHTMVAQNEMIKIRIAGKVLPGFY